MGTFFAVLYWVILIGVVSLLCAALTAAWGHEDEW